MKRFGFILSLLSVVLFAQYGVAADYGTQQYGPQGGQMNGPSMGGQMYGSPQGGQMYGSPQGGQMTGSPQGGYAGQGLQQGEIDGASGGCPADHACGQPVDQPCGDCYCLYCHYEPCCYYTCRCEQVPQYSYRKCCRYVPQCYNVTRCRMVPQYYQETCTRQVPEYYTVCDTTYCNKYCYDKHTKYVPKYYYKHVCKPDCGPSAQQGCAPAQGCCPQ